MSALRAGVSSDNRNGHRDRDICTGRGTSTGTHYRQRNNAGNVCIKTNSQPHAERRQADTMQRAIGANAALSSVSRRHCQEHRRICPHNTHTQHTNRKKNREREDGELYRYLDGIQTFNCDLGGKVELPLSGCGGGKPFSIWCERDQMRCQTRFPNVSRISVTITNLDG